MTIRDRLWVLAGALVMLGALASVVAAWVLTPGWDAVWVTVCAPLWFTLGWLVATVGAKEKEER